MTEEILDRIYDGAVNGCAIVHWLAAEAEIKGRDRTGVLGPG